MAIVESEEIKSGEILKIKNILSKTKLFLSSSETETETKTMSSSIHAQNPNITDSTLAQNQLIEKNITISPIESLKTMKENISLNVNPIHQEFDILENQENAQIVEFLIPKEKNLLKSSMRYMHVISPKNIDNFEENTSITAKISKVSSKNSLNNYSMEYDSMHEQNN